MNEGQAGDARRAIGMDLRRRVPEIFGEMLLANEEAGLQAAPRERAKASEKATSTSAALPRPLAREIEAREVAEPLRARKRAGPPRRRASAARSSPGPRAPSGILEKAGEGEQTDRPAPAAKSLAEADQFEKAAVELHNVIFGAPGMAIARADLKAEPPVGAAAASRSRAAMTRWSMARGMTA